jgi:nitroreductase
MEVTECILTRKAIRAFKPTPVPKELLTRILNEARRCPSASNTQPWEFAVFGGKVMEEMRKAYRECFLAGAKPDPDRPSAAAGLPEPYRSRREQVSRLHHILVGINHDDPEQVRQYDLRAHSFFGAPNGIIVYIDGSMSDHPFPIFDAGAVTQTIVLLAHSYGLGCCIQGQMVNYPDIIRRLMAIPTSKKMVVGISIGYPDMGDTINKGMTERVALTEIVSWHGF